MLEGLKPASVFKFFEEICKIPHGSWNEKGISDYLFNFGKERNLFVHQDEKFNIIMKKPGTPGYENRGEVILQGHMDMVCEKNKDTEFDFLTDPIKLRVDGDFVSACGTTLGADDGIAVAYILALLDSDDIPHPPLCAIITTLEEVGLIGATNVSKEFVTGKYLLNMDTDKEGKFLASCAGGATCDINKSCPGVVSESGASLLIEVTGLKGGHSGLDIDKNRGNANVCLGRILKEISRELPFNIAYISGGSKDNAITREAECKINLAPESVVKAREIANEMFEVLKNELKTWDPGINVRVSETEPGKTMFSKEDTVSIISLLNILPNGVFTANTELGIPETSSNLAVIRGCSEKGTLSITVSVRSNVESKKRFVLNKIQESARLNGAASLVRDNYPGWEYNPNSRLRDISLDTYREIAGKEPTLEVIHAGLECGLFFDKNPNLDIIAFGPDAYDIHTPEERLSISSTETIWNFILSVLKKLD